MRCLFLLGVLGLSFLAPGPLRATEVQPFLRQIMAFYHSGEQEKPNYNPVHNWAEMVLNHLGFSVVFHDLAKGPPKTDLSAGFAGLILWNTAPTMPRAEAFWQYLFRQQQQGKKMLLLGSLGPQKDAQTQRPVPLATINAVCRHLGFEYTGQYLDDALLVEVDQKSKHAEFERSLAFDVGVFEGLPLRAADVTPWLTLKRKDKPQEKSVPVGVGPRGGWALYPYAFYEHHNSPKTQWRINPFVFFETALGAAAWPKPDTTTRWGRRIFYTHIDGDGLRNLSEVKRGQYCGKVTHEEIFQKYSIPTTVSLITAEVNPEHLGNDKLLALSQAMLRLPYVEAGCHAFTHPLHWKKGVVSFPLKEYSSKLSALDKGLKLESSYLVGSKVLVDFDTYIKSEIDGAVDYMNKHLLPPKKEVVIYQWSGNCEPTYHAFERLERLNMPNINGGDSRFDAAFPSYAHVSALSRQVGDYRQVYTSNANEMIYTHDWTQSHFAFRNVIHTYAQTERPTYCNDARFRRIAPMNLYYHFYAAEKKSSLKALHEILDYAALQKPFFGFTSTYVKGVEGFFSAQVAKEGPGVFTVKDYGACQTLRFDHLAQEVVPDLKQSQNVAGYRRQDHVLYVHLIPGDQARVVLGAGQAPMVESAGAEITNLELGEALVRFVTQGWQETEFVLGHMPVHRTFTVSWKKEGKPKSLTLSPEGSGTLRFSLDLFGRTQVTVKANP